MAVEDAAAGLGLDGGQVGAVVDAEQDRVVLGDAGGHGAAGPPGTALGPGGSSGSSGDQGKDIRQVVLALGIVVADPLQGGEQRGGLEGVDAGVDLTDL